MNKVIIGLLIGVFSLNTSAVTPEACAAKYYEAYEWYKENTGFGSLMGDLYKKETYEDWLSQGGVYSSVMSIVGFPVIFLVDIGHATAKGFDERYHYRLSHTISDPDSRAGKSGTSKAFRLIKSKVDISKKDFVKFFHNTFDKSKLCTIRENVVLTERGQAMVGNQSTLEFMQKAHGTPLWDEFWDDARNYTGEFQLSTLVKEELEATLTTELSNAGYPRK